MQTTVLTQRMAEAEENERILRNKIRQRILQEPSESLIDLTQDNFPLDYPISGRAFGARLSIAPHSPWVYSGWVYNKVLEALDSKRVTSVAVLREGEACKLGQFTLQRDEEIIVAWGEEAEEAVSAAITASTSFDSTKFDSDGYLVEGTLEQM